MALNFPFLIAALLTVLIALIHAAGGESTTIRVLMGGQVAKVPTLELRGVWHIVTIHLFATALMLFLLAFGVYGDLTMSRFLALQYAGYGVVWIGFTLINGVGLIRAPQWIALLLIAGLTHLGTL